MEHARREQEEEEEKPTWREIEGRLYNNLFLIRCAKKRNRYIKQRNHHYHQQH